MISSFARLALAIGGASVVLGVSVKALAELALGDLAVFDERVLRSLAGVRTGWLNARAVDFTALGSGTLLVIATVVIGLMLISTKDLIGAVQLSLAASGAALWTWLFKHWFARPRPSVVEHLVAVSQAGYSYPSGHALGTAAAYFAFALVARRHLPRHVTREILVAFTLLLIVVVSASRVYLGVHYASDVLAGVLIGVGWSLLVAGAFSLVERARFRRSMASLVAEP